MNAYESENEMRLRRAKAALQHARDQEDIARKALASAVETSRRAKERFIELHAVVEAEKVRQRRQDYNHCTR